MIVIKLLQRAFLAVMLMGFMLASCTSGDSDAADSGQATPKTDTEASVGGTDTTQSPAEVIAYYFHTTYRCGACKRIEAYSKEAIETGFAEELRNGTLKFESVNVQEGKNEHFVKDYQLYTKSLVICDLKDGKQVQWKNLNKVWQLIRNKDEFINYVQNEISAYLKES